MSGPRFPHFMPEHWGDDESGRLEAIHAYITAISEEPNEEIWKRNETLTDEQQPIPISGEYYKNVIYPNRMT